jgi:hypothetical protein
MPDEKSLDENKGQPLGVGKGTGNTSWGQVDVSSEGENRVASDGKESDQVSKEDKKVEGANNDQVVGKGFEVEANQPEQAAGSGGKKIRTTRPSLLVDYQKQKEEEAAQVVTEKHMKERNIPWLLMGVMLTIIAVPVVLIWGTFSGWSGIWSVFPVEIKEGVDKAILPLPIPKPAKVVVAKGFINWQQQKSWRVQGEISLPGWKATWRGNQERKRDARGAYDWEIIRNDNLTNEGMSELEGLLFEDGVIALVKLNQGGELPMTRIGNWQSYQGEYFRTPLLRDSDDQLSPGQLGLLRVREKKLEDLFDKFQEVFVERVVRSGKGEYRTYLEGDEISELGTEWMAVMEEGQDMPWASEQITRRIWRLAGERWERVEVLMKVKNQPLVISEIRLYCLPVKYSQLGNDEVLEKEKLEKLSELVVKLEFSEFGKVSVTDFPQERQTATRILMNELVNWEFISEWLE